MALLLTGLTSTALAQKNHLSTHENRQRFAGHSHIELRLDRGNALIAGFDSYTQVLARRNVDSVLRLFIADYAHVKDSSSIGSTAGLHLTYRLSIADRVIDQRVTPPQATSFRFGAGDPVPSLLKLRQDTLMVVWEEVGQRTTYPSFALYVLVNSLNDVDQVLTKGRLNARLQTALDTIRAYKPRDLTNPRLQFNVVQRTQRNHQFISPGLTRSPFISLHVLGFGVGLIRNQMIPSLNMEVAYVPTRQHNVGYTVGYTTNFFFERSALDGRFETYRNDFLSVGLTFYQFNKDGHTSSFSRQIAGFQVGFPVYRRGAYFDINTIRLSGTLYHKGVIKLQPELYMSGFFRSVFPGLRVGFGL
jgi:hypothetical protein